MNLSTKSVLLLCTLLLSDLIYCKGSVPNQIIIELPINDTVKTIEIKIIQNDEIPSLTITCLNYDALNDLNASVLKEIKWTTQHGKWILFANCFNNETSHANYKNFKIEEFLNTDSNDLWEAIDVTFHKFAFVDENVFFKNFKFTQYKSIHFYNIGFDSTNFLSNLINNTNINFGNSNLIDFNYFTNNTISKIQLLGNNILNFNTNNLHKFTMLNDLQLYYNNFNNDVNVFNVPKLFEFNPMLHQISIENSVTKIVLHENVFSALYNLEQISLANNQIEHISENLFRELTNLKRIVLDNNKIKQLDENTFELNKKLSYLSLDGNKFLQFSGTANNLNFGASQLRVSLEDIQFRTVTQLQNFLNNPNINGLIISQIDAPIVTFEDFSFIQNRTNQIGVILQAGQTYFNVTLISPETLAKPITEYGTLIQIDVRDGSRMCHECSFIKQVFPLDENYVRAKDDNLNVLFEFNLSLDCRRNNMLGHFYHKFVQNCPNSCECLYNELIDKVQVDCSNKNLIDIPILMYPTQFTHIDSIDLIFKNNLLRTIDFANQNAIVMDKLSSFNFENNVIESVNMDGNPPKLIHYFNICDNPILESATNFIEITTVDGVEQIEKNNCLIGTYHLPDLTNIVQQKSEERVKELLETCV